MSFIYPRQVIVQQGASGEEHSKYLKQIFQTEHNRVKNPN